MKALVFEDSLALHRDYPDPKRGPGEALIRVRLAGICNTDLEISRGYMGFQGVLGHEFVGEVVGADQSFLIGKRVVGEINCPCHRCYMCRKGIFLHCSDRTVLGILNRDGAFAEFVTLPEENLHLVPDSVQDEEAVFTEPLAAAFEILDQVPVRPSERVAVLGDGKLGSLIAQVLSISGCDLIVIGMVPEKLDKIRAIGIPACHAQEVGDLKVDVAVDATGSPKGFEAALKLLRPRGTLVLKTTVADETPLHMASIVIDEITVRGSRCGPFGPALRALDKGQISTEGMIQALFPFDEALEAFDAALKPDARKILLDLR